MKFIEDEVDESKEEEDSAINQDVIDAIPSLPFFVSIFAMLSLGVPLFLGDFLIEH